MPMNIAQKVISEHLVSGKMEPGAEVALGVDQTLAPDSSGTMVMLELEAMGLDRARTELSVQYVDHNMVEADERNADDQRFLRSAARRYGIWFSHAGNGISHPTHMQRFGIPGKTLVGADSHTPGAGGLGMLGIGLGGLEVAMAIAGRPAHLRMPRIWGVELTGSLPAWVSAKDVILEMLRRHGVQGGVNCIIEYFGPGLASLSAMDRHVIASMGTELGATSSIFPSDDAVREFLRAEAREDDFVALAADEGARYDRLEHIDLSTLEPLIALPGSPGNVVPVAQVEGREVAQIVVGSSANPGLRDFAMVAEIMAGRHVADGVSLNINPTSRQILQDLTKMGSTFSLLASGARLHQTGCGGCIGMGEAPATGTNSLRTMPRNFPGRSGSREDSVYLCSPETAAASALVGRITDPRNLEKSHGISYPKVSLPRQSSVNLSMLEQPPSPEERAGIALEKGPNISSIPDFDPLPDELRVTALLSLGDDVSTDDILPGGGNVLPYRSNIPKLSEFLFAPVDPSYPTRALAAKETGGHVIVAGENYGQGSSREHAAIAPRFLGLRAVIAKSFARIHWQNLCNFGVMALVFDDPDDYGLISQGDTIVFEDLHRQFMSGNISCSIPSTGRTVSLHHGLSPRQVEMVLAGALITQVRNSRSVA